MKASDKTVRVDLGSRSYDISIDDGLIDRAGHALNQIGLQGHTAIITNTTIAPLYLDRLTASLCAHGYRTSRIIIPDGEQFKTLDYMRVIYDQLLASGIDRSSSLVALGGGVVGDMTGFAASTFLRGIPFVQIPTTLLAQVDSSVGGKTGVNLPGGKNMVGAFYQPAAVLVDPGVLATLPARELRSGLSEVIKYGIIGDADFFAFLEDNIPRMLQLDPSTLAAVISRCCRLKAGITSIDETEKGVRAHLNFGHTIGHAVETLTGYTRFLHGEAVAIGMRAAAQLSCRLGFCRTEEVQRIEGLIAQAGLPLKMPPFPVSDYVNAMLKDKKKSGDTINFVLAKGIGEVFLEPVSQNKLRDFLASELTL